MKAQLIPQLSYRRGYQRLSQANVKTTGRIREQHMRAVPAGGENGQRPNPSHWIEPLPLVGVTGFEPATSSSRTKRATKLRHTPKPGRV